MDEWSVYLNEGLAYSKTVLGAKSKGRKFGNSVYYNLIGLALESLLTALIMKDGDLPEHSSIGSMMRMLKDKYEMPESFREETRFYNKFMNFCALDVTPQVDPSDEEIERMIAFLVSVKDWVEQNLNVRESC